MGHFGGYKFMADPIMYMNSGKGMNELCHQECVKTQAGIQF